jgi:hypothetical protein
MVVKFMHYHPTLRVDIFNVSHSNAPPQDPFVHSSAFAVLANMSRHMRNMPSYVAHRLVSLFGVISKRYLRLESRDQPHRESKEPETSSPSQNVVSSYVRFVAFRILEEQQPVFKNHQQPPRSFLDEWGFYLLGFFFIGFLFFSSVQTPSSSAYDAIYLGIMQSLLDIFNTIVTHHLDENAKFVYALLMEKETFTQFRTHPQMNTLIENLDKVSR